VACHRHPAFFDVFPREVPGERQLSENALISMYSPDSEISVTLITISVILNTCDCDNSCRPSS
jgi:hypothetical protein